MESVPAALRTAYRALLSLRLPEDPLDLFEGEEIARLSTYLKAESPRTDGTSTVKDEATLPVAAELEVGPAPAPVTERYESGSLAKESDDQQTECGDLDSFEKVLQVATEMVAEPEVSFSKIRRLIEPRLNDWSDKEVRRLLELKPLASTAETLRWALEQPESRDQKVGKRSAGARWSLQ